MGKHSQHKTSISSQNTHFFTNVFKMSLIYIYSGDRKILFGTERMESNEITSSDEVDRLEKCRSDNTKYLKKYSDVKRLIFKAASCDWMMTNTSLFTSDKTPTIKKSLHKNKNSGYYRVGGIPYFRKPTKKH